MITLSGGETSLAEALNDYEDAWARFLSAYKLDDFLELVTPTTISWKVADKAELFKNLEQLGDLTEQVHIGTVNDRFIASVLLYKPVKSMQIVKILERRTSSEDALGLDSIDYFVKDNEVIYKMLKKAEANIVKDHNSMHDWLSLRFGEDNRYEAKFTTHLVLEVGIKELRLATDQLIQKLDSKTN
jgi:hypothetical protein